MLKRILAIGKKAAKNTDLICLLDQKNLILSLEYLGKKLLNFFGLKVNKGLAYSGTHGLTNILTKIIKVYLNTPEFKNIFFQVKIVGDQDGPFINFYDSTTLSVIRSEAHLRMHFEGYKDIKELEINLGLKEYREFNVSLVRINYKIENDRITKIKIINPYANKKSLYLKNIPCSAVPLADFSSLIRSQIIKGEDFLQVINNKQFLNLINHYLVLFRNK